MGENKEQSIDEYLSSSAKVIGRAEKMMKSNPKKAKQLIVSQLKEHNKLLTRVI